MLNNYLIDLNRIKANYLRPATTGLSFIGKDAVDGCGGGGGGEGARTGTCCETTVGWDEGVAPAPIAGGISASLMGAPVRADWSNSWIS